MTANNIIRIYLALNSKTPHCIVYVKQYIGILIDIIHMPTYGTNLLKCFIILLVFKFLVNNTLSFTEKCLYSSLFFEYSEKFAIKRRKMTREAEAEKL